MAKQEQSKGVVESLQDRLAAAQAAKEQAVADTQATMQELEQIRDAAEGALQSLKEQLSTLLDVGSAATSVSVPAAPVAVSAKPKSKSKGNSSKSKGNADYAVEALTVNKGEWVELADLYESAKSLGCPSKTLNAFRAVPKALAAKGEIEVRKEGGKLQYRVK